MPGRHRIRGGRSAGISPRSHGRARRKTQRRTAPLCLPSCPPCRFAVKSLHGETRTFPRLRRDHSAIVAPGLRVPRAIRPWPRGLGGGSPVPEAALARIAPGRIFREARGRSPAPSGRLIRSEKVKTVVTLSAINRDDPKYEAQDAVIRESGVDWVIIPMRGSTATIDQMIQAADLVADPSRQPVFFHCVGGHHRSEPRPGGSIASDTTDGRPIALYARSQPLCPGPGRTRRRIAPTAPGSRSSRSSAERTPPMRRRSRWAVRTPVASAMVLPLAFVGVRWGRATSGRSSPAASTDRRSRRGRWRGRSAIAWIRTVLEPARPEPGISRGIEPSRKATISSGTARPWSISRCRRTSGSRFEQARALDRRPRRTCGTRSSPIAWSGGQSGRAWSWRSPNCCARGRRSTTAEGRSRRITSSSRSRTAWLCAGMWIDMPSGWRRPVGSTRPRRSGDGCWAYDARVAEPPALGVQPVSAEGRHPSRSAGRDDVGGGAVRRELEAMREVAGALFLSPLPRFGVRG